MTNVTEHLAIEHNKQILKKKRFQHFKLHQIYTTWLILDCKTNSKMMID